MQKLVKFVLLLIFLEPSELIIIVYAPDYNTVLQFDCLQSCIYIQGEKG